MYRGLLSKVMNDVMRNDIRKSYKVLRKIFFMGYMIGLYDRGLNLVCINV